MAAQKPIACQRCGQVDGIGRSKWMPLQKITGQIHNSFAYRYQVVLVLAVTLKSVSSPRVVILAYCAFSQAVVQRAVHLND
jgi:hypothetical protein